MFPCVFDFHIHLFLHPFDDKKFSLVVIEVVVAIESLNFGWLVENKFLFGQKEEKNFLNGDHTTSRELEFGHNFVNIKKLGLVIEQMFERVGDGSISV